MRKTNPLLPLVLLMCAALSGCGKNGSLENLSEKDVDIPATTQQQTSRYCCGGLEDVAHLDQQTIEEIRRGRQSHTAQKQQ